MSTSMNIKMNEEQRELFRHAILMQLEAAAPASLPLSTLRRGVRLAGHRVVEDEILKELWYLEEKNFVRQEVKALSNGVRRFHIAAVGRDYLESEGLS